MLVPTEASVADVPSLFDVRQFQLEDIESC